MNWARHSPPDTGGVDATSRRSREASFNGADGVVENGTISSKAAFPKHFGNPDHPVCAAAVASHLFLNGAATPPVSGGELNCQPDDHSQRPGQGSLYATPTLWTTFPPTTVRSDRVRLISSSGTEK
jgi:hypothetical protein